jgi:hypothetical protein
MHTWLDRVLSRRLPFVTEDIHEQPQEDALTAVFATGLRLNTGVLYIYIILMTMIITVITGIAITK